MIDIPWFDSLLEAPGKNQAGLAEHLGVGASAITRLRTDERQLKGAEYEPFADYFDITLAEVNRHVGRRLDSAALAVARAADEKPAPLSGGVGMPAETDGALLGEILAIIRRVHEAERVCVTEQQLGELAATEYDDISSLPDDPARRLEELARLEARLHREIERNRDRAINSARFTDDADKG